MRNKWSLTVEEAIKIADGSKAEAQKNGWAVTIAVVDEGGFLIYLERSNTASPQSAAIATAKAWTAAATRSPTKNLEEIVKERPATLTFPGRVPVQGGLPIFYQSECVGAIGVSGAKSHEDEQIAKAGLERIQ
jgi:glc operon protein GlcG